MGQKDPVYLWEPGARLFKVGRQGQNEVATRRRRRERRRKRSGKPKKRQEKLRADTEQSKEVRGRKGRAGMREEKEVGDSSEERRKERQGEGWKHPGEDQGKGLKRWEEERSVEKRG